jgi:hypothetical protein
MNAGIVAEAAGLFAVTNVDDILVLSLFFGRSAWPDRRGTADRGRVRHRLPSSRACTVGGQCAAALRLLPCLPLGGDES